jgi:cellulose biosynthesis protein BcsQ
MKTIIFTGGFGCGKTLISLHYAIILAGQQKDVMLVDADNTKPCFRLRDLVPHYELPANLNFIRPDGKVAESDIPTVSHTIAAIMRKQDFEYLLLDIPGDMKGTAVLGRLRTLLQPEDKLLYIVNTRRPGYSELQSIIEHVRTIQQSSGLRVAGLVSNTNLSQETTEKLVLEGFALTSEAASILAVPVVMVASPETLEFRIPGWNGIQLPVKLPEGFL